VRSRVHAIAGILGLTLITLFFTASITVELGGGEQAVTQVKLLIVFGLLVLVPSMIVTGGSGRSLIGRRSSPLIRLKQKRMIAIGTIGLGVLTPCAILLQQLSANGDFTTTFYAIQATELIGGAANITLMALNLRAGLLLTGRIQASKAK